MTSLESLNQSLFLYLNATPATPLWQLHAATFLANDVILTVPALLVALWLWGDYGQRSLALKTFIITCLSLGANQVIGWLWPHPRPSMAGVGHIFIAHVADPSFPSDHGTIFTAVCFTLLIANSRSVLAWVFVVLGVAVAWSRIYLGVHYPLDMVGAVGVVALITLAVTPVWNALGVQFTEWACRPYRGLFARPIANGWVRR